MTPENQRQFLYDLCDDPSPAAGALPDEDARRDLLSILAAADGVSPLADGLSRVTLRAVRNQWLTAASRLPHSASSAITAARTLLESTCQTILVERGEAPDASGDLGRLCRQTPRALHIEASSGVSQALHQLLNGLVQVVNGLATLGNQAGDRRGLPEGARTATIRWPALPFTRPGPYLCFSSKHTETVAVWRIRSNITINLASASRRSAAAGYRARSAA